ncbi:MAG: tyrosine-type recombinase/integrase [Chloroflexota bacterium]|nr:tyrosine-type recombinase/integrase [Chloroflexota bacterium]
MKIAIPHRHSLADCLTRYTDHLATTRQYSERTKREYRDDAAHVTEYLETRCYLARAAAVQRPHLTAFLAQCAAFGHAASTRRRSVAAIRSFFAFLVSERIIARSPAENLLPPEREERPPRVLSEDEYTRLRDAAADNPRDAALIELALQTGLRLSEIARLRAADVVLPPSSTATTIGHVRIVGRGTHGRTVTLNERACAALRTYLAERGSSVSPALFLTKFEKGIGPRGIENIMTKQCQAAGISHASVHSLRHTMAVQMLRHGATPAIVGTALGHASSDTTSIYMDLAREAMDEEMQRGVF